MNKKKNLILTLLAVLTVILITGTVTYAFFTYVGEGTTDNVITTDTITFLYTEVDGVGNGITINNAFPISDEVGKKLTKTNEYFDFKVTSKTASTISIPYEITARKATTSDDIDQYVRVYLTKGETEEEVLLDNYNSLTQTEKVQASKYTEKTIYTGKVPANNPNFEETFRLRMWIREGTRFENEAMNNKTFTLTVNVYANAKVVTEEEIALENNTEINTLVVEGTNLTKVEDKEYDYETTLPENTTSTTINIETENPNAKVTVEKIDSLASSNNVKRLAVTKILELTNGENLFKVTVTSENKQVENEFKLKINVGVEKITLFNKEFEVINATPTLTDSSNNTTDASGLYKWTNPDNTNEVSYYFRGNVENYIDFAGFTWRVVRINEDGTIRIVMQDGINDNATYQFNPSITSYEYMYYSNSNVSGGAKYTLDNWYNSKIASNQAYKNRVATGEYYCEEAKVKKDSNYTAGSATMKVYNDTTYTPTFSCSEDGNTKGIVNASVGLLTYDEVLHAGGYYGKSNSDYYLYNSAIHWWTMSPAGVNSSTNATAWRVSATGTFSNSTVDDTRALRPVLNLKADTAVTGLGDSGDHWVVAN